MKTKGRRLNCKTGDPYFQYIDMVPEDKLKQQSDDKKTTMIEKGIKEAGLCPKLSKIKTDGVVKLIHQEYEQFGL